MGEKKKLNITVGCLALVCEYGDDPIWLEVVEVGHYYVRCTNGCGEHFTVNIRDISEVTNDDSVLK